MPPNLDATGHQWVGALAQFNFELECQKGCDNTVVDVLSLVTTWLDPDTVKSILDGGALGTVHWAEVHKPIMVEWLLLRARGMCCHRPCTCTDACNRLGQSPKGRPSTEYCIRLAEGPEEDRFKSSYDRTSLQQARPNDLMELTEICDSSGSLISALNTQGQDQGFTTICSP